MPGYFGFIFGKEGWPFGAVICLDLIWLAATVIAVSHDIVTCQ